MLRLVPKSLKRVVYKRYRYVQLYWRDYFLDFENLPDPPAVEARRMKKEAEDRRIYKRMILELTWKDVREAFKKACKIYVESFETDYYLYPAKSKKDREKTTKKEGLQASLPSVRKGLRLSFDFSALDPKRVRRNAQIMRKTAKDIKDNIREPTEQLRDFFIHRIEILGEILHEFGKGYQIGRDESYKSQQTAYSAEDTFNETLQKSFKGALKSLQEQLRGDQVRNLTFEEKKRRIAELENELEELATNENPGSSATERLRIIQYDLKHLQGEEPFDVEIEYLLLQKEFEKVSSSELRGDEKLTKLVLLENRASKIRNLHSIQSSSFLERVKQNISKIFIPQVKESVGRISTSLSKRLEFDAEEEKKYSEEIEEKVADSILAQEHYKKWTEAPEGKEAFWEEYLKSKQREIGDLVSTKEAEVCSKFLKAEISRARGNDDMDLALDILTGIEEDLAEVKETGYQDSFIQKVYGEDEEGEPDMVDQIRKRAQRIIRDFEASSTVTDLHEILFDEEDERTRARRLSMFIKQYFDERTKQAGKYPLLDVHKDRILEQLAIERERFDLEADPDDILEKFQMLDEDPLLESFIDEYELTMESSMLLHHGTEALLRNDDKGFREVMQEARELPQDEILTKLEKLGQIYAENEERSSRDMLKLVASAYPSMWVIPECKESFNARFDSRLSTFREKQIDSFFLSEIASKLQVYLFNIANMTSISFDEGEIEDEKILFLQTLYRFRDVHVFRLKSAPELSEIGQRLVITRINMDIESIVKDLSKIESIISEFSNLEDELVTLESNLSMDDESNVFARAFRTKVIDHRFQITSVLDDFRRRDKQLLNTGFNTDELEVARLESERDEEIDKLQALFLRNFEKMKNKYLPHDRKYLEKEIRKEFSRFRDKVGDESVEEFIAFYVRLGEDFGFFQEGEGTETEESEEEEPSLLENMSQDIQSEGTKLYKDTQEKLRRRDALGGQIEDLLTAIRNEKDRNLSQEY